MFQNFRRMKKLSVLLLVLNVVLFSCDDGDIITLQLDFDKVLELCGDENADNYVIYDIREDPYESLTFLFSVNTTSNNVFDPPETPFEASFTISTTGNLFNYRTYDGDPSGLICQEIPASDVNIIEDYAASSGTVETVSTFVDDDNDDIPSELEDLNGNGDFEDDDSDGDGIPNYKDADDDNDNVLTKDEAPDPNGDGDISDAQNTDGTDLPDYLDTDDDNDGVITRYEDENLNENPLDDFAPGAIAPRYKDEMAADVFVNDDLRVNTFTRTVTVTFTVINVDLDILNTTSLDLGTYVRSITF